MTRLILASASPARHAVLTGAGIDFETVVSGVDEDAAVAAAEVSAGPLGAADRALVLARAKATEVADRLAAEADARLGADREDAVDPVLGCDSLLELDGQTLGKPHESGVAGERWRAMRGRTALLHTGHWLIDDATGASFGALATTAVTFAQLTDEEIAAYVATGEPLEVAGAFTLDGFGGPFITRIEGDHHNVLGLSLPVLRDLLREIDLTVVDLWRDTDQ